jgi:hypothetical protein
MLQTFDFEKVMKALEDASQIELAYGDEDRSKKFVKDAENVREALIRAVRTVHPGVRFEIPQVQQDVPVHFRGGGRDETPDCRLKPLT